MSLIQDWPTPVTFPEYKYQFEFTPVDVSDIFEGDPNDPNSVPTSFRELFKDVTINPTLVKGESGWYVEGDGILDNLMETAYKHLDAQFLSNRIKQEDYATAHLQMYLGTMQMFSQSFIQFEIEKMRLKVQAALENKKMELELQIARERNESSERQQALQIESAEKQQLLQIASTEKQQGLQIESSEKLSANQIISSEKMNTAQITSAEKQNTERIAAQAELVAAQVQTEIQKKNLHRRQIEGFDEDYKQKIFKIQLDSWAVGASIARDSFIGTSYTPYAIGKLSIDSLYESYIVKDLDNHSYNRASSTLTST